MSLLKFLADENLESAILRGLRRRQPNLDIVRAQDRGLSSTPDQVILEWAAENDRIVLTHDARTMPDFAYERVGAGLKMPGVILMRPTIAPGIAIEDILLIAGVFTPDDVKDFVLRLPL